MSRHILRLPQGILPGWQIQEGNRDRYTLLRSGLITAASSKLLLLLESLCNGQLVIQTLLVQKLLMRTTLGHSSFL